MSDTQKPDSSRDSALDAANCSPLPGSKVRHAKPPFKGQRGRCAWCGTTELPKGRQSWCSQKCVDEYLSRSSGNHIRRAIHERDKGICALCGCDADAEYRAWNENRREVSKLADRLIYRARWNTVERNGKMEMRDTSFPNAKETKSFRKYMKTKYAPGNWTGGRTSGWDADHIVPVVEGGGECGLENYRTLCHPCHKRVTAELAARRADARRGYKREEPQDLFGEANAKTDAPPNGGCVQ